MSRLTTDEYRKIVANIKAHELAGETRRRQHEAKCVSA
jgi:hypothetical protein